MQPGQAVVHGQVPIELRGVHQLVCLAQDDVRHRAEDEERDEDDDAYRCVEKRPVQVKRAVKSERRPSALMRLPSAVNPSSVALATVSSSTRPFLAAK